jgi:regulator of replication initiation timing
MHNLHLDVLRQFQQQSNELSAMFAQQRSSIEALLGENKELRAENENLRNVRRAFQ